MSSLREMICDIGEKNRDMCVIMGVVVAESPLRIQVIGDEKLVLNERITIVPRHLTDHEVTADISTDEMPNATTSNGDPSHRHGLNALNIKKAAVKVYNGLKVGEVVYILSYNHGKKYFVLDREGP